MAGAYAINFTELTARGFKDTAAANYFAIGGEDTVARDVGIAECLATNDQIGSLIRKLEPGAKLGDTRAALAKQLWAILEAKVEIDVAKVAPPTPTKAFVAAIGREVSNDRDAAKAPGPKPAAQPKQPRDPSAPVVRTSLASTGQYIYPIGPSLKGNPRRENTHGWRSMKIILDEPGITTSEYFKRGGRPNDLKWDIDKGNVEVVGEKRP